MQIRKVEENEKYHILNQFSLLMDKYKEQKIEKINPNQIDKLKKGYYITIIKKNAIKCHMFFTTNDNQCTIITHNKEVYEIPSNGKKYMNGTIFEGSMVRKNGYVYYYINDVIYYNEQFMIESKPLIIDRIEEICSIIKNKVKYMQLPFTAVHTGYFTYEHIPLIKKNCVLLFKPYTNYTCYQMKHTVKKQPKYKDGQICLFDVVKTSKLDVYEIINITTQRKDGILSIIGLDISRKMKSIFMNKRIVRLKCMFSQYFNSWIPIF